MLKRIWKSLQHRVFHIVIQLRQTFQIAKTAPIDSNFANININIKEEDVVCALQIR